MWSNAFSQGHGGNELGLSKKIDFKFSFLTQHEKPP